MTVLAVIGDVHTNYDALRAVVSSIQNAGDVEGVLLTGDITTTPRTFGAAPLPEDVEMAREEVRLTLQEVGSAGLPFAYVFGNHDPQGVFPPIFNEGRFAHGRIVDVAGVRVAGLGGASFQFGWAGEWHMHNVFPDGSRADVLLSHSPPPGPAARLRGGGIVREPVVQEVADALGVQAIACGHIHESKGFYGEENPPVLNAGALGRPYPWVGWGRLEITPEGVTGALVPVGGP